MVRKRKEYEEYVLLTFGNGTEGLEQNLSRQIHIDIQRTNATIPLYQSLITQQTLERILYTWAIRHPASGYVQGINDLVTPFFQVFLQEVSPSLDIASLNPTELLYVEADCFWCLSKLLDGIQDNYTQGQPGIQRQIVKLKELINRIDGIFFNFIKRRFSRFNSPIIYSFK